MYKTSFAILSVLSVCLLSSCAPQKSEDQPTTPQVRSLDGVKLISSNITDGYDKSTYTQDQYELGPTERLLLRFSKLADRIENVLTTGTNKVELLTTVPTGANTSAAQNALSVCPLTTNWMMLATWNNAAPFGDSGKWRSPGGDYDSTGCVTAYEIVQNTLHFDVTPWFINYLQARRSNLGLILISSQSVTILGENSGSFSPRLIWNEATGTVGSDN